MCKYVLSNSFLQSYSWFLVRLRAGAGDSGSLLCVRIDRFCFPCRYRIVPLLCIQHLYGGRHLQERWEAEEPDLLNEFERFIEVSRRQRINGQDREGQAAVPHGTHVAHLEEPLHLRHRFVVIVIVLAAVDVAPLEPRHLLLCLLISFAPDEVLRS